MNPANRDPHVFAPLDQGLTRPKNRSLMGSTHTGLEEAPDALPRRADTMGKTLARTTGWMPRLPLECCGVQMIGGVGYLKIDDDGLHTRVHGVPPLFAVDTEIVCAGQDPRRRLYDALQRVDVRAQRAVGAFEAAALDARRAIDQAVRLAAAV
jgi:2,4-dienoyl-CoA reductase (NADPH2)